MSKMGELLKKHQVESDIVLTETEINQQFIKKVMQACQELDDPTRLAVGDSLSYAMTHAKDDDFIKAYGTITSNVLLGLPND
jgi:hypothetical protein